MSPNSRRSYSRADRLNDSLQEVIAEELERLSDPRLEMVTITGVDVNRDLSRAKVYYSTLAAETPEHAASLPEDAAAGLRAAGSHLRSVVGRELRIRQVPELVFLVDHGIVAGQRIEALLRGEAKLEDDEELK